MIIRPESLGFAPYDDVRDSARMTISSWRERVHADLEMRALRGTPRTSVKIAVISDVHGAFVPLAEVLTSACERGADEVWCLGDVVGRGPYARDCLELLGHMGPKLLKVWLKGNHECAMLGLDCCPSSRIDGDTRAVLNRHYDDLRHDVHGAGSDAGYDRWNWSDDAIECPVPGGPSFYLVHGGAPSGMETAATRYTDNSYDAAECHKHAGERAEHQTVHEPSIILAGHTHNPTLMRFEGGVLIQHLAGVSGVHRLSHGEGWMYVNVGSSGGWSRRDYGVGATYAFMTVTRAGVETQIISVKASIRNEVDAMQRLGFPSSFVTSLQRGMGAEA